MNSKRFLSVLLAVLMVLAVAAPSMAQTQTHRITDAGLIELDENGPVTLTATLDKEVAHPGDTVTLTVSIAGTYQAHAGNLKFKYEEDYLETIPSTYVAGSIFSDVAGCMVLDDTDNPVWYDEDNNPHEAEVDGIVGIGFLSLTDAVTAEGMLFSISFKVKEDIDGLPKNVSFLFEADSEFNYIPVGAEATPIDVSCNNVELEIRELEGIYIKAEVDKTNVKPGDTFTLTLSIVGEYTASSLVFEVPFDTNQFAVAANGIQTGSVIAAARELGFETAKVTNPASSPNLIKVNISFEDEAPSDLLSATGTIATITFTVKDTATDDDWAINYQNMQFVNYGTAIDFTYIGSTVTVSTLPDPVVFKATADKNIIDDYENETFTVTVSVSGGYSAAELTVELPYDDTKLELVSAENVGIFSDAEINGTVFTASSEEAVSLNGTLFTATFKFIDEKGSQDFLPTVTVIKDGEGNDIEDFSAESCNVHVRQSAVFTATPSKTSVLPGEEFTVTFSIGGDYMMHGLKFKIPVDFEGLEFVSKEDGAVLTEISESATSQNNYVVAYSEVDSEGNLSPRYVVLTPGTATSLTGDLCTVTYRVSDDAALGTKFNIELIVSEFLYMVDADSYSIDYESEPCTVTVGAPKTVDFTVSGNTFATVTVAAFTENDYPTPVAWYGYQFDQWSMDVDAINAALEEADSVTVEAEYVPVNQEMTVTIISSEGTEERVINESKFFVVKTAPTNADGQKFLHWTMDGVIINYSVKASIRVEKSCTIEAHYGDSNEDADPIATILRASYDAANRRETFVAYMCPLDGHTITKCGVVASPASGFEGGELTVSNAAYVKEYEPDNPKNPAFYTWIKTNVEVNDVWYIRAYIITDGVTFYGDLVTVTAGDVNP